VAATAGQAFHAQQQCSTQLEQCQPGLQQELLTTSKPSNSCALPVSGFSCYSKHARLSLSWWLNLSLSDKLSRLAQSIISAQASIMTLVPDQQQVHELRP